MPLSSNSLIHLTKEKKSLIGILQENFKIHYCLEEITTRYGSIHIAVPMVSFCDIPLSEIKNHISKYGRYGLGLKKEWAIRNKLNPIFYLEKESELGSNIRSAFISIASNASEREKNRKVIDTMINLFQYMKNYQNDLVSRRKTIKNYRYNDEREWRYVPLKEDVKMYITKENFRTSDQKRIANNNISHLRLNFSPDDITYIFIEDESEINEFIDVLRSAKGKVYTQQQVEKLMTRIFTTTQIETDI